MFLCNADVIINYSALSQKVMMSHLTLILKRKKKTNNSATDVFFLLYPSLFAMLVYFVKSLQKPYVTCSSDQKVIVALGGY